MKILSLKFGRYIMYELRGPVQSSHGGFDSNVKIVTKYEQIKNSSLGVHQESFERLLANNTKMFAYFERDIPLGMMWGHRGGCYIRGPGIPLLLDEKTVYWFWIYILPEARGRGVYKKLRNAFFNHYNGCNYFTALVDPCNKFMRNEMSKIGFAESKSFYYIKYRNLSTLLERCNGRRNFYFHIENGNQPNRFYI